MEQKEIIFKYAILSVVYISFLLLFWPFKTALLLAALFAMAVTPLLNRWVRKFNKEKLLIFFLVSALLLVIIAPLTMIVTKGILNLAQLQQEGVAQLQIYQSAQVTMTSVWHFLNEIAGKFNVNMAEDFDIQSLLPRIVQTVIPWLTALVTNLPEFLLQLFIFVTMLYFFLWKRRQFQEWVQDRKLLPNESLDKLIVLLQKVCYTVVFSTMIVASVQAGIIALAASIAGFDNLMIIFVLTFFMSFFPVVGSVPVSAMLAAYSFLQGDVKNGVIMLVALGIAGSIDNVIRAYILSAEDESLHPLISLLTLIGALAMFGMPGLFLGPIIAELAFAIGRIMNGGSVIVTTESEPPHSP